jgi:uncharacterized protein YbjT (DUF2867 family)
VLTLLEHGAPVRLFVRSLEKAAALPAPVERVAAALANPAAVARAVRGAHAAFSVSPHDDAEEQFAEQFVSACEQQGVRLVFAGVHADGANRRARPVQRTLFELMDELCREQILDGAYPMPPVRCSSQASPL